MGKKFQTTPNSPVSPGPGAYKLPSLFKGQSRQVASFSALKTTFGTSERDFIDLAQGTPGPNHYRVAKFTEASHGYSFPVAPRNNDTELKKQAMLPNPQTYSDRN